MQHEFKVDGEVIEVTVANKAKIGFYRAIVPLF